jgi:predicted NBD/HSP70 family sugar kinase
MATTTNTPGSPPLLRRLNSALVLRTIRDAGPLSRSDIAKETGLSKPTVNEVAEVLLRAGYVSESIALGDDLPRRPGPRARILSFRADLGHVLGIDIGANKILATVADLSGEILASERRSTAGREDLGAAERLREANAAGRTALRSAGVPVEQLRAVGVGTPGIVDPGSGEVTLAPQLRGWEGLPLGQTLARSFPCPVLVDNEVHLAVLAERWRGAAQGIDEAVYLQVGVGIGAGILIGGELYRGVGGAAGEIGYLPTAKSSKPAGLDLGPFEFAAGGSAFARLGREVASRRDGGRLRELARGDPAAVDAEIVFAAARDGDAAAAAIVDELVARLARGIASVVVVLNPATVIVGGGLSRAGSTLLEPLQQRVDELVPRPPHLVLSPLGEEAVALGAARLAIQSVEERLFSFQEVVA